MNLVEFEQGTGLKVWINPEHVTAVTRYQNNDSLTAITLVAGNYTVKGPAPEIVEKLKRGSKS